jgi:glycosyltransferase involved in cell wall biosynthesis
MKDRLKGLNLAGIVFTGYLPDLGPLYEQARIFVAPLRFGAGIKGKVLEAIMCGLPVVTTTIGAEGIGLRDGENILVDDDPTAFAASVARLHSDERLWETIRRNGRHHVEANFSRGVFRERVEELLQKLLGKIGERNGG